MDSPISGIPVVLPPPYLRNLENQLFELFTNYNVIIGQLLIIFVGLPIGFVPPYLKIQKMQEWGGGQNQWFWQSHENDE